MYDPTTAQWTTEDPIEFDGGDTNLRRYVGNDPVNETDPSGQDAVGVQGDNVVWRVSANNNRSGLRKFWDGLMGQNQNPERSYVIGRVGGEGGYLNSVVLSDELGGGRVSLADLQQAARVVNLGGVAPEQQAGAIAYQIQKTIFGLYGSETPTQDRIVGALSSGMQFAIDNGKMVAPVPPGVSVDSLERVAGITPGGEADGVLGGFVGNPNGSAYYQGKMEGEAGIMMVMALDSAVPGGLILRAVAPVPQTRLNALHFPNGASDDFARLAGQISREEGFFDLYVHSNNSGTVLAQLAADGKSIEVADMLAIEQTLKTAGWDGQQPIRLIACRAGDPALGKQAAAQQVAEFFGVKVLAPTEDIVLFKNGAYVITNKLKVTPRTPSTGTWKEFGE